MLLRLEYILLILSVPLYATKIKFSNKKCDKYDLFLKNSKIYSWHDENNQVSSSNNDNTLYIIYDVNPGEGFNLRRDVYIRLAVFVRNLRKIPKYENTKLILPPFPHLYHWKSRDIRQHHIFWNEFFDLKSLKQFTPVLDIWEFFNKMRKTSKKVVIDHIYRMKYFENVFEDGKFIEKFEVTDCDNDSKYHVDDVFGYGNLTAKKYSCLEFQGSAWMLKDFLEKHVPSQRNKPHILLLLHAETVLHDHWGNRDYWQARRSMRFNKGLTEVANEFRKSTFNSTNDYDQVQRPYSWLKEKPYRNAVGGKYLCAHIRRADFVQGREKTTPTLMSAALQIKDYLKKHNLHKVFISSDCTKSEFKDLKNHLIRYKVTRFTPQSHDEKERLKDGGIAIVDQIICSHAAIFIGTYESTFTYRIYEEREILGFPKGVTFNTFCKYEDGKNCERNSIWPIAY